MPRFGEKLSKVKDAISFKKQLLLTLKTNTKVKNSFRKKRNKPELFFKSEELMKNQRKPKFT